MTNQPTSALSASPTTPEHGANTRQAPLEDVVVLSSVADARPPGAHQVVAGENRVEGLTVTGLQRTGRREDTVSPAPPRPDIVRRVNTRRYSIEIKDIATEKSVCAVAADWTEYEKRSAISCIMRLAGLADERR